MRLINLPTALLVSIGIGYGGLVSPQAPLDLERSADLIVVGSVGADIQVGAKVVNFDLQVSRVVKGDPAMAGQGIAVSWTSAGGFLTGMALAGRYLTEKGTGLWFLKRSGDG